MLYCSDEVSPEGVPAPARAPIELARYGPRHEYAYHELTKATAVRDVQQLARRDFDVFLNLCDGAWDEARPGIEVVVALERLELAFTGAGTPFYEPSREAMKRVCHYLDIRFPRGVTVRDVDDAAAATSKLRFPMIVKHPNSYNSIGLTPASKVHTPMELENQVDLMLDGFGGALVEEFVDGREFTVLVAGQPEPSSPPKAYPPVECVLPAGETFKHYELKWRDYPLLQWRPVTDDALARELMGISAALFHGLSGSGYARCDVRVGATGIPYMLEINPNCSVFYPPDAPGGADAVLLSIPGGHEDFLGTILTGALARRRAGRRCYVVQFGCDRAGLGMYAATSIAPGERITAGEEQPHTLVSRAHAAANWPARERRWLEQYGYPLNDEVLVTWSSDPEQWSPINHSCDPNAWIDGLDLVARRAIEAGEEITVEYATFIAGAGDSFDCQCGADDCRGRVTPEDWQLPEIRRRYAEHCSAYVAGKWASLVTYA
ncbi:MAG TPA: SET domain-containing protein-lysine N-methyltransferase [Solirubrobacteraceae bacterium]|nr:SET domain-containing protein-lysine N-methyltransferase [Solirubrobacteraceae bacterium]